MKTNRQNKVLIWTFALISLLFSGRLSAQILDYTQKIDPPITDKAIFYASVLVSDLDENGTVDELIGLSQGDMAGYGSLSCIIRWTSGSGYVDAHNGSGYSFDPNNAVPLPDLISQPEGEKYEVWFEVDVIAGRYTPWVKGPGMTDPVKILDNVEFRAKGVAQLDTWTAVHQVGGDQGLDVFTVGEVDQVGDRHPSYNEASIKQVSFSPSALNGTWDPEVTNYTATFPYGTTTAEVSATAVQHGTRISNQGTLDVSAGSGQLTLEATSESGDATKTYTVDWSVNDPAKDATLSALTIDVGDSINFPGLSPAFGPTTTEYMITVPYGTKEVNVNATASAAGEGATVAGAGMVDISSGTGLATIVVTSADQSSTKTYTVEIVTELFNITGITLDATLFNGNVVNVYYGIFERGNSYVKDLPAGTVSIGNLSVTANDSSAIYEWSDELVLVDGEVTTQLTAIPEDLSDRVSYDLTLRVLPSAAPTQTGKFETTLSGTHVIYAKISYPSRYGADGVFGLSSDYMTEYSQFSAGFRFVNGLPIQLHNGGYTATDGNPNMAYDTVYHCWMSVDFTARTYSVYYTVEGETQRYTVGEDAVFRNGLDSTATQWGAYRNNFTGYTEMNVMKVELVSSVGDIPDQKSDATLSGINLSAGKLNEAFTPGTNSYTATLPYRVTSVNVTAEATDPAALVTGQGWIQLDSTGTATDTLTVLSDDGSVTQNYFISFDALSAAEDASLSELFVEEGAINPVFDPEELAYSLTVPYATDSIHVGAVANSDSAAVTGDGAYLVGDGVTVDVVVVSKDQSATQNYTIEITKEAASNDATLSHLRANNGEFDKAFDPTVFDYVLTAEFGKESVEIRYLTTHPGAIVSGGGTIDLVGKDKENVSIVVTAEDGTTTSTYSIEILIGEASSDATLKNIILSSGTLSPIFDPETYSYTVDVVYGTSEVEVTAVANQEGAVISGDGTIDVTSGSGTANILVTAQDGTELTYTVAITVLPGSDDATLSSLNVLNATLEPEFDPAVFEYIAVVPLGTATATLTAVKNDDKATVTGAGALDVISGSGVANVVVTSETGNVSNTYQVTVYVGSKPKEEEVLSAEDLQNIFNVYPNPASNYLTVDLTNIDQTDLKVSVFNLDGRTNELKVQGGQKLTVDLTNYSKGLYMIRIETAEGVLFGKFIKD